MRLQGLRPRGDAPLPGLAQQPARRAARELKDLAALLQAVQREADRHVRAAGEQLEEDAALDACEVRESVHIDVARAAEGALRQAREQTAKALGGVRVLRADGGEESAHDKGKVLQLLPQGSARHPRGLRHSGLVEARGAQLVHGAQEFQLQLRRAARARVDAQAGIDPVQGQGHAEQPPARLQGLAARRAQLGLHLPRKAREGQHLGIERQARPRDAGQLPLRLVAVLLRHEQHAPALSRERRAAYLLHYERGLTRSGPACYQSKQGLRPPFRSCLHYIITRADFKTLEKPTLLC